MHEAGIVEDLIESIGQASKNTKDWQKIKKVYIRLGKSAGLTESSLRFWFEYLGQGTKLEGATLELSEVEGNEVTVDSLEVE